MDSHGGTRDEAGDGRGVSYLWHRMGTEGRAQPLKETTRRLRPYIRWTVCSRDPIYSDEADDDPQRNDGRLAALSRVYTTLHRVPVIGPLTHFRGSTYLGELSCRIDGARSIGKVVRKMFRADIASQCDTRRQRRMMLTVANR